MRHRKQCSIREQIIHDPATGLTLQFEVLEDGGTRLKIYGDCMEFGARQFHFDEAGFSLSSLVCRPDESVRSRVTLA